MLFHSSLFLCVFLPAVLASYYLLADRPRARIWLLIAASLLFYGYWDPRLLPLLVGSILGNWLIAQLYLARPRSWLPVVGVALNLVLLGFFKYANLAADTVSFFAGLRHERWDIVLPVAISFFTFQQISYLVDLGRGRAPRYGLADYALFVSFFPQLIAGPIVRHHEIIGQFALDPRRPGLNERIGRGLVLFAFGLAKKVLLADELAKLADPVFESALAGGPLGLADSWTGLYAFTFQLYFDFSAYSDMALGLGLLFGFQLPVNFDRPYAAASIRDFWRRWHMTLSRFFRDYVYRPIGLRLAGPGREAVATLVTMSLVGLWHGAAWSYALWGLIHGVALVVNQAWRERGPRVPALAGWLLTFHLWLASLTLFRSESVVASLALLESMIGLAGIGPAEVADAKALLLLVAAAGISIPGPTSQALALERLIPSWRLAGSTAAVLAYAVLKSNGGLQPEFIYFQF